MLNPEDLSTRFDDVRRALRDLILSHKEDVSLSQADSRIARAVEWLISVQRDNGAWGNDNVACTSTVMLALDQILASSTGWALEEETRRAVSRGEQFLVDAYAVNGYENTVWDTALAVRALNRAGTAPRDFVNARIAWLLGVEPRKLNAGPHHLAQRTLALAECAAQTSHIERSAADTARAVAAGQYNYSPYVLAQCLQAVKYAKEEIDTTSLEAALLRFLEDTHLDSANFVNICSALDAFRDLLNPANEKRIRLSVASLFGETCFRDNGTWYRDETSTAWALIALTRFSKEVVIRAPQSELVYDTGRLLNEARSGFRDAYRREVEKWALHFVNAFICGALLAAFVTYTSLRSDMTEWLKWGLPALFVALASISLQFVIRYLRRDAQ